jgi:putative SOS response-associated peptidase YedK
MCGRMTMRAGASEMAHIFDAELRHDAAALEAELGPRYNVAPTQPIPVVVERDDGRAVEVHRWGLVPSWATSVAAAGARYINARAETVATSPVFHASFLRRRCVIAADGFYEWRRENGRKLPFHIRRPDHGPLAFAGLWAPWRDPATGEWTLSATVVTTQANAAVGRLHDRMPVILDGDAWPLWLDSDVRDPGLLQDLLRSAPDDLLELVPAAALVNNANNEGPALLAAVEEPRPDPRALTLFG